MKRGNAYDEDRRTRDRFASTLVIAAAIIAAVRLAEDETSAAHRRALRLSSGECVGLARMRLDRVLR
jgi:hypothetical protein